MRRKRSNTKGYKAKKAQILEPTMKQSILYNISQNILYVLRQHVKLTRETRESKLHYLIRLRQLHNMEVLYLWQAQVEKLQLDNHQEVRANKKVG